MNKTDTADTTQNEVAPNTYLPTGTLIAQAESRRAADASATRAVGGALRAEHASIGLITACRTTSKRFYKAGRTAEADGVRAHLPHVQAQAEASGQSLLADAAATAKLLKPGASPSDRARYRIALALALKALV